MANVAESNGDAAIWGGESSSKITRRRVMGAGAVLGSAALAVGLYFGLQNSSDERGNANIISGQSDANALGCFVDDRSNRVLDGFYKTDTMTPAVCNAYCDEQGAFYYALQYGEECWCGAEGVDLSEFGVGQCDYACTGDVTQICGGYLAFTAYEVGVDAETPTPTPAFDTTCDGTVASVRFTSTTAYFESGGCATLTDMYNAQEPGEGPVYVLDEDDNVVDGATTGTGRWLLTRDLRIIDGVTLFVHGLSIGGDADVLRIESTSSDFYEVRGHGGSLSFHTTKVTSWDTSNNEERQWESDKGRSYINCVTQFNDETLYDCDGRSNQEWGECRMDIIDSVMGNMGYFDAESYGLTWKVRGACKEIDSSTGVPLNHEIFEDHNVYGDIKNSEIYGMYYGHYSYGHQGGVWTNNIMRDNILYGFDPHDDSDDLTISNNVVYGNGNHGIIASKRCNNVEISNNEVYNGGENAAGIFLHRSSDNAQVFDNYVHDMQDAGIAMMESSNSEIYDNTIENTKYGIRLSLGCEENIIRDNSFDTMSSYGFYTYMGSDDPDVPGNNGFPKNNVFDNNTVIGAVEGVKINQGTDNVFTNNEFTGAEKLIFSQSDGNVWTGNDIGGACLSADDSEFADGSPNPTIPLC